MSEKSVSRRGYLKYAGAGVVVIAVAGAGVYYGTSTRRQPVELRGVTTSDPNFYLWDKDSEVTPGGLMAEYEKNTGVKAEIERIDWMAHYEKTRLELSSQSPTYDYICYDSYVRGSYLPNSWLADMKELESKTGVTMGWNDIIPKIIEDEGTFNGELQGFPSVAALAPCWVYRKSLFEDPKNQDDYENKYGRPLDLPKNWDELKDLDEFFTRDGWYGQSLLMAPESSSDEFYFRWLNMGGGKGGRRASFMIVDDNFEPLINNDIGIEALQNIVDIYQNKWCAPGGTEVAWVDITSNFFAGDVAMGYMWSCAWPGVDDPNVSKAAGDVGWYAMPLAPDGYNGHASLMMAINKFGNNLEETYKFLAWMFSPENDKKMGLMGNCGPIRISTYEDPDIMNDPYSGPSSKAVYQMIEGPSVPQCDLPEFGEMNYNFSLEIQKAAEGSKTVEQALDDTEKDWRDILSKAGYY